MGKQHLSRLAMPRSWPVERKKSKWIARPMPGSYGVRFCLPISVVLKDVLRYVKTRKEVNFVLNEKGVLVDKVVRMDRRFPVGFMDVFELPRLNEYFRVVYDRRGRLCLNKIGKDDSRLKLYKIINKVTLKGRNVQLNMSGGRNILIGKEDYAVGDSVVFDLVDKSIKGFLRLEKGALVYLTGGRYIGCIGKVKEIISEKGLQRSRIVLELEGRDVETLKSYAFVIGKYKHALGLEE